MGMTRSEMGKLGYEKVKTRLLEISKSRHELTVAARGMPHCKLCGIEMAWVQRENDFCSRRCGAINTNRPRRRKCAMCESLLSGNSRTYCSHKCRREHRYKEAVQQWHAGEREGGNWHG